MIQSSLNSFQAILNLLEDQGKRSKFQYKARHQDPWSQGTEMHIEHSKSQNESQNETPGTRWRSVKVALGSLIMLASLITTVISLVWTAGPMEDYRSYVLWTPPPYVLPWVSEKVPRNFYYLVTKDCAATSQLPLAISRVSKKYQE